MADPLSVTASLLALLDGCAKIITYIREVKDGSSERTRLLMEILSTKGILESLTATLKDVEAKPQTWSETSGFIHREGGPLEVLHNVLTALLLELAQASRASGVVRLSKSLMWPFTKKDIEQRLKIIDRQKLLLTLAMENDHVALSREIQSDVCAIRSTVIVIQNDVAGMRSAIEQRQESENRTAILNWLSEADYVSQQNDFISLRQPGTGEWLLESEEFRTWMRSEKQTLFCPGIPGAGKTILTSVVIDHLNVHFHENDNSIGIAYLYCNFRRRDEQTTAALLLSLLQHLVAGNLGQSSLPQSVQALYKKHTDRQSRPSVDKISSVLKSVAALYSRVFILVDALDECQASERNRFLSEIFELQAHCGVSIFATSRNVPEIVDRFRGATSLEIRATSQDVGRYVEGHMSHLPAFVHRNLDLQVEIKAGIVEAVDGMFLLAQLYLNSLMGKRSPKGLRASLAKLPSGSESEAYDRAYEEAMERIQGQLADQAELAKQVIMWITCAERPLGVEELRHALGIEPNESSLDQDNLPEIEDMVSVCAGLVTVDQESSIVRLVHYTTQKYFERTQARWFPDAEKDISASCVTYLLFDDFNTGPCQSGEEFMERLSRHKLYGYVTLHWGKHVYKASTFSRQVLDFLRSEQKVLASTQAMFPSPKTPSGYSTRAGGKMTGLHLAACFGLVEMAQSLLLIDPDPDPLDVYGHTPLSWAARSGHEGTVEYLLNKGASLEPKNDAGQTPLLLAIKRRHHGVIRLFLSRGADINTCNNSGMTALNFMAWHGNQDIVQDLLDYGADTEIKDKNHGYTPLMYAADSGHVAILQQLLDRGANIDAKNRYGLTVLMLAAREGREAVVKILLAKRMESKQNKGTYAKSALTFAVFGGHESIVRLLLAQIDSDPDLEDRRCRTPLSYAAQNDRAEIAMLLLATKGVDPNHKDDYGATPLLIASVNQALRVVKTLLATGLVEVDPQDAFGRTPLWWARKHGNRELQQLLFEYAEEKGVRLRDTDIPMMVEVTLRYSGPVDWVCGLCTLGISPCTSTARYECRDCDKLLRICLECYKIGGRCLNDGHDLVAPDEKFENTN